MTKKPSKFESVYLWYDDKEKRDVINISIKELEELVVSVKKDQHKKSFSRLERLMSLPQCDKCGRAIKEEFYISSTNTNLHFKCFQGVEG